MTTRSQLAIGIMLTATPACGRLRCGMGVEVWPEQDAATRSAPFVFLGLDEQGFHHSWGRRGNWREDGLPHPLDLLL